MNVYVLLLFFYLEPLKFDLFQNLTTFVYPSVHLTMLLVVFCWIKTEHNYKRRTAECLTIYFITININPDTM